MNLTSFFRPTYDEILADLRLRTMPTIIEQPRNDAGRFVSKRDITRARLERLASRLTPTERSAAISRAMTLKLQQEVGR